MLKEDSFLESEGVEEGKDIKGPCSQANNRFWPKKQLVFANDRAV